MKKLCFAALLLLFSHLLHCQVWFFGQNAGVDFSTGKPVAVPGPVNTDEGISVVYDRYGQVWFSTDGSTVYGFDHKPLPNGSGLGGHASATQSALLVPCPGTNFQRFFLFTVDAVENNLANGMQYSVIDRTLNTPNGDVVAGMKNLSMPGASKKMTEKLAAVSDGNGGFWVVAHGFEDSRIASVGRNSPGYTFYAWHITDETIPSPVVSQSGGLHNHFAEANAYRTAQGQMTFSPDGTKLALAVHPLKFVEVFDFSLETGVVNNATRLSFSLLECEVYGTTFSPSGRYLYVSTSYGAAKSARIYQIDIGNDAYLQTFQTARNEAGPIRFKAYPLAPATDSGYVKLLSPHGTLCSYGSLQLGPDGVIYAAATLTSDPSSVCNNYLDAIHNPDSFPATYVPQAVTLSPGRSRRGLPNLPAGKNALLPGNTCNAERTNLITNSDFNDSILAFKSGYIMLRDSAAFHPGMALVTDALQMNSLCPMWIVKDHSTCPGSTGRFLVVNGSTGQAMGKRLVWEQTVQNLKPGATYRFCAALKAIPPCCFAVQPRIDVRFDAQGFDLENVSMESGAAPCDWMTLSQTLTVSSSSLTIRILLDETMPGDGNDFALDDLGLFLESEVR
ncbi:MAG: hypothetical protein IT270_05320 [Saprospiraceae bacterium]|nr:hypothetical protein [Saprospiraceae bacterium]